MSFPALSIPSLPVVEGYRVDGSRVGIGDQEPDHVVFESAREDLDGARYEAYPFESVDCTARCGGDGWRELHALLWNADHRRAVFGILYLPEGDSPITLSYPFALRTSHGSHSSGSRTRPGPGSDSRGG